MSFVPSYPDTRFNKACRCLEVDRPPVWIMRQAGRYLPLYQELKAKYTFIEICKNPELAAKATLDAADYLDTDAAIIFSDIMIPAIGMGLELDFNPGPILENPVRTAADVDALKIIEPNDDLPYVMEAIRQTREGLPNHKSLIGFVGAPLTMCGYLIEGGPNKNWTHFKEMLYGNPALFEKLIESVTQSITRHAAAQIAAGCDAIQLFDSNAGQVAPKELHEFGFRFAQKAIAALKPLGVPIIYFARDIGPHFEAAAELGADVLGVDWSISLSAVQKRVGNKIALMGNLDPGVLFTSETEVETRVQAILDEAKDFPGFIFNLGHGILPKTPPENAVALVKTVQNYRP